MRKEGFQTIFFWSYTCYTTLLNFKNSKCVHERELWIYRDKIGAFFLQIDKMFIEYISTFLCDFHTIYFFTERIKHLANSRIMNLCPISKHHHSFSKSLNLLKIMSSKNNGNPLIDSKFLDKLPNNFSLFDIDSGSRLIKYEKSGAMHQSTCKHKATLHTT